MTPLTSELRAVPPIAASAPSASEVLYLPLPGPPRRWRDRELAQRVPWPDAAALRAAERQLALRPPLVAIADCRLLAARVAQAGPGGGFLLQAGPCAESFADDDASVDALVALLGELAARLRAGGAGRVVGVARVAGQYAKPRSAMTERVDGELLPTFRGHAVHDEAADPRSRRPDPARLVEAYRRAARTLRRLAPGAPFTSHEALLLEYEEALTRRAAPGGDWYATSAHTLWVGDRTRGLDGAHVAYLAEIANPVAVKLGPSATPDDVAALCRRLNPGRRPGRLTLVTRLGAADVHAGLPPLLAAAREEGQPVTWLCDPMHANTRSHAAAGKFRLLSDIVAELRATATLHRAAGSRLGGVHLELTAEDVHECVDDERELVGRRYTSLCDPRLNAAQARRLVGALTAPGRAQAAARTPPASVT